MPKRSDAYLEGKRREILAAARRVALQKGFAQTSLRDIAGEAGMSMGSIANYFARKHDILVYAAERARAARAATARRVVDADDPAAALVAWLGDLVHDPAFAEEAALELELVTESSRSPDVREVVRDSGRDVLDLVSQLVAEGSSGDAATASERARLVLALTYGLAALALLDLAPSEDTTLSAFRSLVAPGGPR